MNAVFIFAISAVAIVLAGVVLTKASEKMAEITGIGRLMAGSILLAGATSMPELMVGISAVRDGMPDLATGNLFGGCLMNLLILAIADLMHRSPHKMLSRAGARHALSAAMSINLCTVAALAIFLGPFLQSFEVGEIGVGPIMIGIIYVVGLRLVYQNQNFLESDTVAMPAKTRNHELIKATGMYLLSAIVIFIAAPVVADSAGDIAEKTGLGDTFIGTTLVSLCTTLPEMVSTITAVRMGAFDLAVGNIFGSNAFNLLLLIPLDWFHEGSLLAGVSRSHILTALAVILATSVAVMGQLYQEDKRKKLVEPDAFAVIAVVIGALFMLYWTGLN